MKIEKTEAPPLELLSFIRALPFRLLTQRITQLYEQGADSVRIGQYVRKWGQWVHGGGISPCTPYFKLPNNSNDRITNHQSPLSSSYRPYRVAAVRSIVGAHVATAHIHAPRHVGIGGDSRR